MGDSGEVERASPDTGWMWFAQARLDDEVVAAARFGPNAPGRCALSSLDAFGQRQILKAQGRHHGERLVIALTSLQIHALSLSMTGRLIEHLTWDRATAFVMEVPRKPGVTTPSSAVCIGSPSRHQAIEVVEHSDGGMTAMLLAGLRVTAVSHP